MSTISSNTNSFGMPAWHPLAKALHARLIGDANSADIELIDAHPLRPLTLIEALRAVVHEDPSLSDFSDGDEVEFDGVVTDDAAGSNCTQFDPILVLACAKLAYLFAKPSARRTPISAGAVTVLEIKDANALDDVRRILKHSLFATVISAKTKPHNGNGLTVLSPLATDGNVSQLEANNFARKINTALRSRSPLVIILPTRSGLPNSLFASLPASLTLPPVDAEILTSALQICYDLPEIDVTTVLHQLFSNTAIKDLSETRILLALRQETVELAVGLLCKEGPISARKHVGIEALEGTGNLFETAKQIVYDLNAYCSGQVPWTDIPRGTLLTGPPGTGKTFAAACIAASAGVPFINTTVGEWQSCGHLGDMQKAMRKTFSDATALAPCLLVIDEIDSFCSRNGNDQHGSSYRRQVINEFLSLVDGVGSGEGVMLIGATNHPEAIDPAILRAGRFDNHVQVGHPSTKAIENQLRRHLRNDLSDIDITKIVRAARGKTPAELAADVRSARAASRAKGQSLSLEAVLAKLCGSTQSSPTRNWTIAVHEAGHALLAHIFNLGRVTEMRIGVDGGLTVLSRNPVESDMRALSKMIAFHLAGRAAEHLLLGKVTAGSGGGEDSDLALATRFAIQIERSFGLGLNGLLWESTLRAMTENERIAVQQRLNSAEILARSELSEHRHALKALALALFEEKHLYSEDISHFLPATGDVDYSSTQNILEIEQRFPAQGTNAPT